jgi:hypothetical protein
LIHYDDIIFIFGTAVGGITQIYFVIGGFIIVGAQRLCNGRCNNLVLF